MTNRRTPLYDWHVAHKARMVPFGGWDMPVQYAGIIDEHRAVRTAAGLFDVSHMARLSFEGPDALALLESVFTNSVATMKEGQVRYGLLCDDSGGILDDVLVYRLPDGYSMVANASNREKVVAWLDRNAAAKNTQVHDQTETTALVAIQGPRSVDFVAGLFETDVSALKYYFATKTRYRGQDCLVSRTGYTGEDGFEVCVPNELAVALCDELTGRGAVPCGLGSRDTLRLEAAMPLYGHELTEAIDPIGAGLGWAVKLDKGEFVGRGPLLLAQEQIGRGPRRVGLELEGKRAAREGCAVVLGDGRAVGTITSGSYTPWLEKSLAMAYVEAAHADVGTQIQVDIRGSKVAAKVVALPFYKRKK
ncbi:glycine cleavage system aminomethyltransferase GcvT [Fimbriiglobus ruber]|uniref:Aminomethyltransferase n=1 Tax=Fimbriiglobus ruber TaxID=1908690 RepID=A0A225D4P2_9BACT|nr:glycine cleavage system aminomethyltransferase GcvT [Fimbriiglobus ruber]OWK36571.1 glycine cleavage system protein T [Fimbriiglobus ruber]